MKYLISETTKEERKKIVEKALSISLTGASKPTDDVLSLVNDYIEGKKELKDIQKCVISYYKGVQND